MSTFEDLKKKAEAQVAQDKAATESWVKANRLWLIAIGVACVLTTIFIKGCVG